MSTRNYRLDGVIASLAIKAPCRVKTTGNITLSGMQTIDAVAVAVGDRVLVGSQSDASENGIYDVKANTWERAKDFNGPRDITKGTFIYVNEGNAHAETFWKVTSADDPITIGTSDIAIESISVTGATGPEGPTGPAGADGTVDLTSLTNETTVDPALDELLMRDASEGVNNAIIVQVLWNSLNALSAETAVDSADSVAVYDATGAATDKATVANLLKSLATLATVTPASDDLVLIADANDSNNAKKITVGSLATLVGGGFSSQLLHVQDRKAAGTDGGTFTASAWQTRVLNTAVTNEISGAALSSNQITLPAGTYYIDASVPATLVIRHQAKLRNVTDGADVIIGTSELSWSSNATSSRSVVCGRFTIAAEKTFEIQHYCSTTGSGSGFGWAANFGVTEVYTDAKIWKVG